MRPVAIRAGAALLALALSAALPARALVEAERGDVTLEAVGSIRLTAGWLRYPDVPAVYPGEDDGLFASVVRLLLDGMLGAHLGYEVNLYGDFSRVPTLVGGGVFATAASFDSPYRTGCLSWDYAESGGVKGELGVDRLALDLEFDRVHLTVGRFPVNHSVTRLLTPNDFFAPFSAAAINKEYKPGVDALRLAVTLGMLSSVEVAGVMGYGQGGVPEWGRSALLARASAVLWKTEWAALGGRVARRWILGGSIQGEAGPFGLFAEGHAGFPDADGDGTLDDADRDGSVRDGIFGRLAAGFELTFAWHNTALGAEYLFISDGARRPDRYIARAAGFYPDDVAYFGRHYVAVSAGGEIIPILRVQTMLLANVKDFSGMGLVSLAWSAADEIEILAGVLAPWGEAPAVDPLAPLPIPSIESEFGTAALTVFLEGRFYF